MDNAAMESGYQNFVQMPEQFLLLMRATVVTYGMRVPGAIVLIIIGYLTARLLSRKLAADDSRGLSDPEPFIKVDSLGDSSVNILFRVYARTDDWWEARLDLTRNP
jgi:small-conductance mechanosensitive channel